MALMEEVQSYRRRIKQLEDDLLFRLSNSQATTAPDFPPVEQVTLGKEIFFEPRL